MAELPHGPSAVAATATMKGIYVDQSMTSRFQQHRAARAAELQREIYRAAAIMHQPRQHWLASLRRRSAGLITCCHTGCRAPLPNTKAALLRQHHL